MKKHRLARRSFLGGALGATIGLPLLEVMDQAPARAQASLKPLRYVVAFAGVSLHNTGRPTSTGSGYTMPTPFASLEPLRDQLTLVSDLEVPANGSKGDANATPMGGRPQGPFHNNSVEPILTGCRSGLGPTMSHVTSDQVVADALAGTTPIGSLQLRVQAEAYVGGFGTMSAKQVGGTVSSLPPIANPLVAYETLFGSFTPAPGTVVGQTLAQRRSVLDLVGRRAQRLLGRVSRADKLRLERHYDEIRALESRLTDTMMPSGPGCQAPPAPTVPGGANAYSGEDERGRLLSDLLHMAFVCDQTRVASVMLTFAQCQMSAKPLVGHDYACHELTHSVAQGELGSQTGNAAWGAMNGWHVGQIAYLAQKLKDTPEDDETLLDRTAIALLFEAGTTSSHSTKQMVVAVLGRGDVLRTGRSVAANGARPAQVLQTLMDITGVSSPFGEVPGTVPQMLA